MENTEKNTKIDLKETKEKVVIPACKAPNAKFSKSYKALFNK